MEQPPTSDDVATVLGLNDGSFEEKVPRYRELASLPKEQPWEQPASAHLRPFLHEFMGFKTLVCPPTSFS